MRWIVDHVIPFLGAIVRLPNVAKSGEERGNRWDDSEGDGVRRTRNRLVGERSSFCCIPTREHWRGNQFTCRMTFYITNYKSIFTKELRHLALQTR